MMKHELTFFALSINDQGTVLLLVLALLIIGVYVVMHRYNFLMPSSQDEAEIKSVTPLPAKEEKVVEQQEVMLPLADEEIEVDAELAALIATKEQSENLNIKYNYSYTARLTLAPAESLKRYNIIKNHIVSFPDITASISWKEESFLYKNKAFIKIRIHGNTMRLYLALDPTRYLNTKYFFETLTNVKEHEHTPVMIRVKGSRGLLHAKELINDVFLNVGLTKGYDLGLAEDYSLPPKSFATLREEGLIKEVN